MSHLINALRRKKKLRLKSLKGISKLKLKTAFGEVFSNTPRNVIKSGKTGEAKRKMLIAIALSKARNA